jgi:adenylate kinase family enzyme
MLDLDLQRVVVVGICCSGKTTFARRLAASTGAPFVELDALHWGPNWSVRPDFREVVRAEAERTAWVIDGNYSAVRDLVWARCTAIVWLDYRFGIVFGRAVRRTIRGVLSHELLYSGNRESLSRALFDSEGVLWWILRKYWKKRREITSLAALPKYQHARFIALSAPAEAERFLQAVERKR